MAKGPGRVQTRPAGERSSSVPSPRVSAAPLTEQLLSAAPATAPIAATTSLSGTGTVAIKNRAPAFDQAAFEAEGFPSRVARSFLDTAEELDAVIASRCPSAPATQLIDDGHDMKSFYVHAKSCNWG